MRMNKKLLFSLAMLATMTFASAKEITFTYEGEPISNGSTIEFEGYEKYEWTLQTEVVIAPEIFITKDSEAAVDIRTTSNYPIQVCIGGLCVAETNILKEGLLFEPNTPNDLLLDATIYYDKGQEIVLPKIEVLVEAWYSDDPTNVTKFTLKMGDVAGITDATVNANVVALSGKTLNYNVKGSSNLTIYNLSGRAVLSHKVNGAGSISLASLPVGIYLYRVAGTTGKFIVK